MAKKQIKTKNSRDHTASVAVNLDFMKKVEGIRRRCVDAAQKKGRMTRKITPSSIMYQLMLEGAKHENQVVKELLNQDGPKN